MCPRYLRPACRGAPLSRVACGAVPRLQSPAHLSWSSYSQQGNRGGEGRNKSLNRLWYPSSPIQGFLQKSPPRGSLHEHYRPPPSSFSLSHTRWGGGRTYEQSQRQWGTASGAGIASRAPRQGGSFRGRAEPKRNGEAPGTHQLLQVLLRELRVTVPLLLELVPGGFGHHYHPGRAEAAVGAATTPRQLARLTLPQVPPAAAVTAEARPRGRASRARAPQRRRPAARHATTAAQQEASVASHRPPGGRCRPGLPAPLFAPTCAHRPRRPGL